MMRVAMLIPFLLLGPVLPCCNSGNEGSADDSGATGVCGGKNLIAASENNYQFSSTLKFPSISVAPNTDLTMDWSGVTTDFVGHTVDVKKDLSMVSILMWNLPLTDLETKLNSDSLKQSDLTVVPITVYTDGSSTTADVLSFTLNGTQVTSEQILPYFNIDNYPPENHTYILTAATGTTVGQGIKMVQSFLLDSKSTNSKVTMTSHSTQLSYTANLHSLTPTRIPVGEAAITLDWGQMKTNALGNTFSTTSITTAMVAHYTQTPTQLETQFLDLELIATAIYNGTIDTGTSVDFSSLADASGATFTGIDDTGTWIVALQCGSCRNPAPWYLTILKPCS